MFSLESRLNLKNEEYGLAIEVHINALKCIDRALLYLSNLSLID